MDSLANGVKKRKRFPGSPSPPSEPTHRQAASSPTPIPVQTPMTSETSPRWQNTIDTSINAIVSIRFSQVSAFDTEAPCSSEASGFVVDKTRGIILTNRHVVCGAFALSVCL